MPALFQDSFFTRSQWVERLKGGISIWFPTSLKTFKTPPVSSSISTSDKKKKEGTQWWQFRDSPALPPQTCWVVWCQPSKGQINKSTSTIVHRLFHRTTSCFENPSSRWWTSQCGRKTKNDIGNVKGLQVERYPQTLATWPTAIVVPIWSSSFMLNSDTHTTSRCWITLCAALWWNKKFKSTETW